MSELLPPNSDLRFASFVISGVIFYNAAVPDSASMLHLLGEKRFSLQNSLYIRCV